MMQTTALLLALILWSEVATKPIWPVFEGWTVVSVKDIEPRGGDYKKEFLGLVFVYNNPNNKNEFIRAYFRYAGIISERPKEESPDENKGRSNLTLNTASNYHLKEQQEKVKRAQEQMDLFAAVRWHTKRDPQTETDILDGLIESWLLDASGELTYREKYSSQIGNDSDKIKVTELTVPTKDNPDKSTVVGLMFHLGEASHIIRIDQSDLVTPKKEEKKK